MAKNMLAAVACAIALALLAACGSSGNSPWIDSSDEASSSDEPPEGFGTYTFADEYDDDQKVRRPRCLVDQGPCR